MADHRGHTVLDELYMPSSRGIDGVLLRWIDFEDALARWVGEVMARLLRAQLRQPHRIGAAAHGSEPSA